MQNENTHYIICYFDQGGAQVWERWDGEDAMHIRVDELVRKLDCNDEDIMVFTTDTQL